MPKTRPCPHCRQPVKILSRTLGVNMRPFNCPHCGKPVQFVIPPSTVPLIFFVAVLASYLLGKIAYFPIIAILIGPLYCLAIIKLTDPANP